MKREFWFTYFTKYAEYKLSNGFGLLDLYYHIGKILDTVDMVHAYYANIGKFEFDINSRVEFAAYVARLQVYTKLIGFKCSVSYCNETLQISFFEHGRQESMDYEVDFSNWRRKGILLNNTVCNDSGELEGEQC